jgi:cell division protein FtsL
MVHQSGSVLKKKKKPRRRKKKKPMPLPFITLTILLISSLIFLVWSRIQVTQLGYRISQASHEQEQLLQKNSELKIEEASLKTPARIEDLAKNQLGLINPEPHQKVFVQ